LPPSGPGLATSILSWTLLFFEGSGGVALVVYLAVYNFTITNGRLIWSLHIKPPRIPGGYSKKIEKFYKFSQKIRNI
jgi:hypothetical protein